MQNNTYKPSYTELKNTYCSSSSLGFYLKNKRRIQPSESDIYKTLIDQDIDCWQAWNKVRWDAAMNNKGVKELKEYLGNEFIPYYDSSWALANEWSKKNRKEKSEIADFYKNTHNYIYNSLIFYESGDRVDFHSVFKELKNQYSISTATEFGCSIGNDGLAMLDEGVKVNFVDFNSPSIEFLKWRLVKRNIPSGNYRIVDVENKSNDYLAPDLFWAVDVLEHMVNPLEIFDFITNETKVIAFFVDADDEAGGRHPFHFKFNENILIPELTKRGFVKKPHYLLSIWSK